MFVPIADCVLKLSFLSSGGRLIGSSPVRLSSEPFPLASRTESRASPRFGRSGFAAAVGLFLVCRVMRCDVIEEQVGRLNLGK